MNGVVHFVQSPLSFLIFYLLLRTSFVLLIHVLIQAGREFISGKYPSSLWQIGKIKSDTDSYLSDVNDNSSLILNLVLLLKITVLKVVPAGWNN